MQLDTQTGLIKEARFCASPNHDRREHHSKPEVIIIHCISLPPGDYNGNAVERFFCNQLDANEHPYYSDIKHLTVSAHFFIRRDGELIQFVPTTNRAWHAGESVCLGKPKVNDFSIGIELEGLDTDPNGFTDMQYRRLNELLNVLYQAYPSMNHGKLFAHSDIAPGRKTDPGPYFDWQKIVNNST